MAVKTITIDMEAYTILSKLKKDKESFSQVIKKTLGKESKTAENLLQNLDKILLSDETLDNIENIIKERESFLPDSPVIDGE